MLLFLLQLASLLLEFLLLLAHQLGLSFLQNPLRPEYLLLPLFCHELVLLHDLLHLEALRLASLLHLSSLSFPRGLELQALFFHLLFSLLELMALSKKCHFRGLLGLLYLSLGLEALLRCSSLPLVLDTCLELAPLLVALFHLLLPPLHFSRLLLQYALSLCLELLLLYSPLFLPLLGLSLSEDLEFPLFGEGLLFFLECFLGPSLLFEQLFLCFEALPLFFLPLSFFLHLMLNFKLLSP